MKTDEKPAAAVMSVKEFAKITGQTGQAVRAQIAAGTCAAEVVVLRRPAREGGRPRYAVTRTSVARLLGEASP